MKAVTAGFVALLVLFFVAAGANQGAVTAAACTGPTPGQVPAPTSGRFTMKQLADLWVSVGGPSADVNGDGYGDAVEAAAIAMAESGGDPNVRNSIGATGIWQIYNSSAAATPLSLRDPVENAHAAVAKFMAAQRTQGDGFAPWTSYTGADTGPGGTRGPRTFLKFLTGATPGQTGSSDGAGCANPVGAPGTATAQDVAANPHIILMPGVPLTGLDPRIYGLLAWIGKSHEIIVTATTNGQHARNSWHYTGNAIDIGMVDGHRCGPPSYSPADSCGQLAIAMARLPAAERPNQLIACFDPDSNPATDANGGNATIWAAADHCDHVHAGVR